VPLSIPHRNVSCLRVFGEFEDAKDTENADDDERSAALGRLTVALCLLEDEHDEVRHDRQHVKQVHHVEGELALGRTGQQSQHELDAEPRHARGLHHVERVLHEHVRHGPILLVIDRVGTVCKITITKTS